MIPTFVVVRPAMRNKHQRQEYSDANCQKRSFHAENVDDIMLHHLPSGNQKRF
jgi:hypothetical protein